jgi:hypothetical protein
MPNIDLSILNQRQTPAFFADTLANRPSAGFLGRIFVSTDTFAFYRDNGSGWDLIGGPGTGTITGSGASGQVSFWNGASTITGSNDLFWDSVNGHLGIGTITPSTALTIFHDQNQIIQLNQTTATNDTKIAFQNSGTPLWRIGNSYNAGANDYGIFDVVGAIQPLTIKKTTGQTFIGAQTTSSGRLVVNDATGDNHIVVIGATAPSLRINNSGSGATKQIGIGLATATNNFIQGSADRDMCIFNGSTTPSPILFGVYATTNIQEAVRISSLGNLLVNTSVDNGKDFQVSGTGSVSSSFSMVNAQIGGPLSYNEPNGTNGTLQFGNYTGGYLTGNIDNYIYKISGAIGSVSAQSLIFQTRSDVVGGGFAFVTGTTPTPSLYINGSGNIGINRTNQEFPLDVNGDIALPRTSKLQFTGGTAGDRQRSYITGNPNNDIIVYAASGGLIATFHNSTNFIVGNGVDNGYKLQVIGSCYIDGTTFINSSLETRGNIKRLSTSTTAVPSINTENNVGSITQMRTWGTSASGVVFGVTIAGYSSFDTNNGLGLLFGTTDNAPIIIGTNDNERMRIKSTGVINIKNIPTSAAGLSSGDIYSNAGILTIVP